MESLGGGGRSCYIHKSKALGWTLGSSQKIDFKSKLKSYRLLEFVQKAQQWL